MKKHLIIGLTAAVSLAAGAGTYLACQSKATAVIANKTGAPVTVYLTFGADSVVTGFPFCTSTGRLGCKFPLANGATQALPLGGKYLNATLSVSGPVTCGMTKAELNLNNPAWYDIADISLVDGFSTKIGISATDAKGKHELGPVTSQSGNEKAFGVYPYGCDICVERQNPPCSIPKGKEGCKTGPDQYHPDVPCQYQGTTKGGGTAVVVTLGG
jgi:hypothetical protein